MRGESGLGGRFGSACSSPSAPINCAFGGGGDAWPATALASAVPAREAGIGGDVLFLDIFARAGAASGTWAGGMAAEWS